MSQSVIPGGDLFWTTSHSESTRRRSNCAFACFQKGAAKNRSRCPTPEAEEKTGTQIRRQQSNQIKRVHNSHCPNPQGDQWRKRHRKSRAPKVTSSTFNVSPLHCIAKKTLGSGSLGSFLPNASTPGRDHRVVASRRDQMEKNRARQRHPSHTVASGPALGAAIPTCRMDVS